MLMIDSGRATRLGYIALLFVLFVACQGRPSTLAIQAGGSVMIPVQSTLNLTVGFGGKLYDDYQRGGLIYQLDGPGGFELDTRVSFLAMPGVNTSVSNLTFPLSPPEQVVSLVDIPDNAPLGTHSLHVLSRRIEGGVEVDSPAPVAYAGTITILPPSIQVTGPSGLETVVGTPTPFESYACILGNCGWSNLDEFIADVVPKPAIVINLNADVYAADVRLNYPTATINVLDAYEPIRSHNAVNKRAVVWLQDTPGQATVRAAAQSSTTPFRFLAISFDLDDGLNQILQTSNLSLTVLEATNANGQTITVNPTLAIQ
jgi:hypothetical protein